MALLPHTLLALTLTVLLTACFDDDQESPQSKQTEIAAAAYSLYFGGDILTMAGKKPSYVEAIVEQDGQIVLLAIKLML